MNEHPHPLQALLRLLEIGQAGLLEVSVHGNELDLSLLDGEMVRRLRLTIIEHDLPLTAAPEVHLPPPPDLAPEKAEELGVPLYFSRAWFVSALLEHRTTDRLADAHGLDRALMREIKDKHGIDNPLTERIRERWMSGEYRTHKELAAELKISTSTISKAVGNARDLDTSLRITELLRAGLSPEAVILKLREEGDRRGHDKLLAQIRRAKGDMRTR